MFSIIFTHRFSPKKIRLVVAAPGEHPLAAPARSSSGQLLGLGKAEIYGSRLFAVKEGEKKNEKKNEKNIVSDPKILYGKSWSCFIFTNYENKYMQRTKMNQGHQKGL